jgi:glycosyltransferase involved in cell wall biosynthesis
MAQPTHKPRKLLNRSANMESSAALKFSLVLATVGRTSELEPFLEHLQGQSHKNFELIVVDQNPDDRLLALIEPYRCCFPVVHCKSAIGLSRARNVGLQLTSGNVITFPDDDCWYPESLLYSVTEWLAANPGFDALFTTVRSADNQPVGPRWPPGPVLVTKTNLWASTISFNAFLRRAVTDSVGYFREDIGVGANSPYQSGEESDYFLRALSLGFSMWYEPAFTVHHPNLHSLERLRKKTYRYALGCGYVLRLHGSWREFAAHLVRSIGGAVFSLCKGNISMAEVYLMRAAGQLHGYRYGPRDLAGIAESRSDAGTAKI